MGNTHVCTEVALSIQGKEGQVFDAILALTLVYDDVVGYGLIFSPPSESSICTYVGHRPTGHFWHLLDLQVRGE